MELTSKIQAEIEKIIVIHAPKYKVPGYETDDIMQEAYIMALDCLRSYDESRGPFENFLNKHLYFRLKTFVRDKTLNYSIYKDARKSIMCPMDISLISSEDEISLMSRDNVLENVEHEEILRKIDEYLPISLRRDYLKMKAGVKINRGRANKIKTFILSLLQELTGEPSDE